MEKEQRTIEGRKQETYENLEADQLHIYPDNFKATQQTNKANHCYAIVDQELLKKSGEKQYSNLLSK